MPDNNPAGATPVVAGATPAQTPPPTGTTPVAPPPATGELEIGDAGKRAIDAMKAERNAADTRAKAAERELETLRTATLTDSEKALKEARREAAAEVGAKYDTKLIRADLRGKLKTAGVASDAAVELALKADVFTGAKLDDDGRVIDGDKLIEAFTKAFPEMVAPARPGTVTAGAQTGQPEVAPGYDRLSQAYAEIGANRKQ